MYTREHDCQLKFEIKKKKIKRYLTDIVNE